MSDCNGNNPGASAEGGNHTNALGSHVGIAAHTTVRSGGRHTKTGHGELITVYVTTSSNTMKIGDRTITSYDKSSVSRNDNGGAMFSKLGYRLQRHYPGHFASQP